MGDQVATTNDFFDVSKGIVERFIQSVVAVDDKLVFDPRPENQEVEDLEEPEEEALGATDETIQTSQSTIDEHTLFYQELSTAFAKKGIVCSGFRPFKDNRSETIELIFDSSKNADVTILDWHMDTNGDNGSLAIDSIKKIIENDLEEGGRLRLFTIYTAENPDEVVEKVQDKLQQFDPELNGCEVRFKVSTCRYCRIDIKSKELTGKDLTEQIIESFTQLTAGLLSNAALSAITDSRNKTHNILYKFNKDLDPAYLSHVLGLISSPDMREQAHEVARYYAIELLSDEIKSELQMSKVLEEALSRNTLHFWPKYINNSNKEDFFGIKVGNLEEVNFNSERMASLLKVRTEEELISVLAEEPKIADCGKPDKTENDDYLRVFFKKQNIELSIANGDGKDHLELSAIQCVKRDYSAKDSLTPEMRQGTVLRTKLKRKNVYYVCIQPPCDSLRLSCATNFTFLRISKARSSEPFTHVIRDKENHLRIKVDAVSKKISVFNFEPCSEAKIVKASSEEKVDYFFEDVDGQKFTWLGELKPTIAQEIVNTVSASMSRVGFDSFEWLRLKSGG